MSALRAEWTKYRTVRGWVLAVPIAALAVIGLGVGPGMQGGCGKNGPGSQCLLPTGPDGIEVSDSFTFVHQPLAGDGSLTVRVASLATVIPAPPDRPGDGGGGKKQQAPAGDDPFAATTPVSIPWAKAGLIVKDGVKPGSTYAAVMLTESNGVRLQHDFTHDQADRSALSGPVWLRLTRHGDAITGYESADGTQWTEVSTVHLPGLPATAQVGLFATAPQYWKRVGHFVLVGEEGSPSRATAVFDHVSAPGADWRTDVIGGSEFSGNGMQQTGDQFTVTGSGDIAPNVPGSSGLGVSVTQTLVGTFIGLMVILVVAAVFVTAEYRRGLIRSTLSAIPHRGRVLGAKSAVVATVGFVVGVLAAAVVVTVGQRTLRANGVYVHPITTATELRLIVGTGALLAVSSVLAVAVGVLVRRSAVAVTAVVVGVVLPYLLAVSILPPGPGEWLLRVTPAAAFAIQQSAAEYAFVSNNYIPNAGYFPLPPWGGFAVLCAWTAAALIAAHLTLSRRDA
jgi:ABC-type transport system involved in multi-copper enzyme maturation permease subunit